MRQPDGSHLPPPDATMLRIVIDGPGWARRLPAVPLGCVLTATVSAPDVAAARSALEARGYTFAGVHRSALLPPGLEVVDLLVPAVVMADHPDWWRVMAGSAYRAFPLAFGPVLALLSDLLTLHVDAGAALVR